MPGSGTSYNARLVDSSVTEGDQMLPLTGVERASVMSLNDACVADEGLAAAGGESVSFQALKFVKRKFHDEGRPPHGLSFDEAGAIAAFTAEQLYPTINERLRIANRGRLRSMYPYLRLLLGGLAKLPRASHPMTVYRGIDKDVHHHYNPNDDAQTSTWWSITSVTTLLHVVQEFMTSTSCIASGGMQFMIEAVDLVDISEFSYYPGESEWILLPGTELKTISRMKMGGVWQIQLKQVPAPQMVSMLPQHPFWQLSLSEGSATAVCPALLSSPRPPVIPDNGITPARFQRLRAFYTHYAPEKTPTDVYNALGKYADKYDDMWEYLVSKYGPESLVPKSGPTEIPQQIPTSEFERLRRYYRRYCPEKTDEDIQKALLTYLGRSKEMWTALCSKYGPEPIATVPCAAPVAAPKPSCPAPTAASKAAAKSIRPMVNSIDSKTVVVDLLDFEENRELHFALKRRFDAFRVRVTNTRNYCSVPRGFLADCSALTGIDLSEIEGVTRIEPWFLKRCQRLPAIDLSSLGNVETIGEWFLYQCSSLVIVTFPPTMRVRFVDKGFMACCNSLKRFDLSAFRCCEEIGYSFMVKCGSLEAVDLSGLISVTEIGSCFLQGCKALRTLDLGSLTNVKTIGGSLLSECFALEFLILDGMNHHLKYIGDKFLFNCVSLTRVRGLNLLTSVCVEPQYFMEGVPACVERPRTLMPEVKEPKAETPSGRQAWSRRAGSSHSSPVHVDPYAR